MVVWQLNFQRHFGGGEVYTSFLCHALDKLGVHTRLLIHPQADFWSSLSLPPSTILIPLGSTSNIESILPNPAGWILSHGPLPPSYISSMHNKFGLVTAIAHMPVQDRNPDQFRGHDMIFPVSEWVRKGLLNAGLITWNAPIYGVAHLKEDRSPRSSIQKTSRYDWDHRKVRDHILSKIEPFIEPLLHHPKFEKRKGITLGIVSRLTPIKQLPLLFSLLAPVIRNYPQINIEIFGSGGYASVRDLKQALAPIRNKVRYWGHQSDVTAVYQQIDYLMTGLPEKEALGLNIIEAQTCGTPVLAPRARPFTETIIDGITGFFYTDPRDDNGNNFGQLLDKLISTDDRIDPLVATEHLNKFTIEAFIDRIRPVVEWAQREISK